MLHCAYRLRECVSAAEVIRTRFYGPKITVYELHGTFTETCFHVHRVQKTELAGLGLNAAACMERLPIQTSRCTEAELGHVDAEICRLSSYTVAP